MSENNYSYVIEYGNTKFYKNGRFMTSSEVLNELEVKDMVINQFSEENKLYKERISLLSSLLDLADAIIDTSDNEKAKQVWDNKNEQTEKEWERILNE